MRVERPPEVADARNPRAAKREILHVHFAGDRGAGIEQPGDDRGVEVRDVAFHEVGAEGHRHAGHRDVILEADRASGQQSVVGALHPAFANEHVQGVPRLGGAVSRVAFEITQRRTMFFGPQFEERLHRGDLFLNPVSKDACLGVSEVDAKGVGEVDNILDFGALERHQVPLSRDGAG